VGVLLEDTVLDELLVGMLLTEEDVEDELLCGRLVTGLADEEDVDETLDDGEPIKPGLSEAAEDDDTAELELMGVGGGVNPRARFGELVITTTSDKRDAR